MLWLIVALFVLASYAVLMTALWWLQKQRNVIDDGIYKQHKDRKLLDDSEYDDPILQKADESQQLLQTFQKFVPRQFVDHFSIVGAESLKLGYANEDEVAVMFCDIRGFTGLSEKMSPQQLMNFLNSYFTRMNAPIHNNFGFIDKFIGDAIMALFDHPNGKPADKASDAVTASLDLQKALRLYNHHRASSGYTAVKNGIGLHFGPVVIGTVGSDDRMDTTVIGDAVNIAQRIESLTDYFSVDILASRDLVDAASQHIEFAYRLVDTVVLKGRSGSVEVIDIYQHLEPKLKAEKDATIPLIEEGIRRRNKKDFSAAIEIFADALTRYPHDKVLQHHLDLCKKLIYEASWDGNVYL